MYLHAPREDFKRLTKLQVPIRFENPNGESDPNGINKGYTGSFKVSKKKATAPTASFWFWAEGNSGGGEIHYYFNFSNAQFVPGPTDNTVDSNSDPVDTCDLDNRLPDVGCVTYVQFSDWELKFEGSGKDKKRACQCSGTLKYVDALAFHERSHVRRLPAFPLGIGESKRARNSSPNSYRRHEHASFSICVTE